MTGRIAMPIVVGGGGLLSMTLISFLLQYGTLPLFKISPHKAVNYTFTMQAMVLPLSFAASALVYKYRKESFKVFFRRGDTAFRNNRWNFYGPVIAISFTAGTALLMSSTVAAQNG